MDVFVCEEKTESGEITGAHPYFGLILTDLEKISPNYESLVRSGQGRNLDTQFSSGNPVPMKGRGTKRKLPGEGQTATSGKKVKSDLVMPKLPPNGYPLEHPYNKDGYRYILAEPDPHAPFRQEFDDSTDWAGKPIPGWLYRKLQPSAVLLAMHDRESPLCSDLVMPKLPPNGYPLEHPYNKDGYRYILAEPDPHAPFRQEFDDSTDWAGKPIPGWLYRKLQPSAVLLAMHDRGAPRLRPVRLLLALPEGTRFHESRGYHYSDEGYGAGDTLGFLIQLPRSKEKEGRLILPDAFKDRPLVKFKSYLYYEEKDEVQQAIKTLRPLPGSRIAFYKNGECVGTAWQDVNEGTYYPAVSLYKNCTVRFNFGPDFKHMPRDVPCLGINEIVNRTIIQQTVSDLLYLVENERQLKLDATCF
ncbi:trithorax protein ash2, putative [Ixodes scapularis]|uniref:Trithorax protein ash2, putative n=1 Tax=Ixodes scapularis TaxID=6945 RepID=B7QLL6_IXOSC|nr:trithorax protein ash2, putative [Ixodes scapularis]|eukprot:XP_002416071.1 trithorax protein ash2, putative [Ixodes scapularis]